MADDALEKLTGAAAGIGVGVYVLAVIYQGNIKALGSQIVTDEHYVEFLSAIIILWMLKQYGPTHEIVDMLLAGAAIGLLFKLVHNGGLSNMNSSLQLFAQGKQGLFETIGSFFDHQGYLNTAPGQPVDPNS
jgi:hypothetical protein